jgi:hypothetical protein
MSTYRFNKSEKWAVWKTHGPNCRWCNEPVLYKACQIDHILPENIEESEYKRLTELYGVHEDFDINSFYNWIPIHSGCNQSKSDDVFDGAPFVGQLIQRIGKKHEETLNRCNKMANEPDAAKIISSLERGIEEGIITEEDVNQIFLDANEPDNPVLSLTASTIEHQYFILPQEEGWQVIKELDGENQVTKDGRFGYAPSSKTPDLSWLCGNCKHFGPWDGNRCLTCGTMSYPD